MNEQINRINNLCNQFIMETDLIYHDIFQKLGLSDSAATILYALLTNGGSCMISEICRLSGLPKQTLNSALRKLETDGVVFLEAADKKKKTVCLTEKGKELSENTVRKVVQIENEIFAEWTEEERQLYVRLLEKYMVRLKEKMKLL